MKGLDGHFGGGIVGRVSQQVLPLLLADAVAIGPVAGLVENADGGVVFVSGLATFAFAADDEVGRRLAAVQLVGTKIASLVAVSAAFGVGQATVWRWKTGFDAAGVAGLIPAKRGPKRPSKLTDALVAKIRDLDGQGVRLAGIAAQVGLDTATVRVALGRRAGSAGWQARHAGSPAGLPQDSSAGLLQDSSAGLPEDSSGDPATRTDTTTATATDVSAQTVNACARDTQPAEPSEPGLPLPPLPVVPLPVVPLPVPRTGERAAAHAGLLEQAPVVFTQGAHLPMAGLLLILPALETTGLLAAVQQTYGRLRNGFYGLRSTVLTLLFLALLRDPRAEGATRIRPADLGRVLGLDRAPEVKTLRRKLTELSSHQRGAQLQAAVAKAHAAARPQALGFLLVDGHTRVYSGTRDLPKTHLGRMHMAGRATNETWIGDADADPVLIVTAPPGASLASELVRILPDVRAFLGPGRRATVIFDRGGWSPATFAAMTAAGLDILTYRKGPFDPLPADEFTDHSWVDPDGRKRTCRLAETTVDFELTGKASLTLRQIHKMDDDGTQIPILTSRTDLPAAEVCWRLGGRWRQENYFKYARTHFALDALDSYQDTADDPGRMVPNPAKKTTTKTVEGAKAAVSDAEKGVTAAISDAVDRARQPGSGGRADVDGAAQKALDDARANLQTARDTRAATPSHVALRTVRPEARLLDEERKLLTHAIRMAAYNSESTLTRIITPHYARADDEARALIREAMTLSGDIRITGDTLHVTLDPATAPRRSRALHALCQLLTATETIYPDTELKIVYNIKGQPDTS